MKREQAVADDPVRLRMGDHGDLEFIVEMGVELRNTEVNAGKTGYVGDFVGFVTHTTTFFHEILDMERFMVVVAEAEGVKVGCAVGEIQRLELFFDPPVLGNILMMVVREEYRRARVGVRLLGAIEALMYEAGVRKVVADCYQGNVEPQMGLLRCGYQYEHVRLARDLDGSRADDGVPGDEGSAPVPANGEEPPALMEDT